MKPTHTIDFLGCLVNVAIKDGYVVAIDDNAKIKECPRCMCSLTVTYQLSNTNGLRVRCMTPNCDSWSIKPI
jgi:hypothetical protein